MKKLLIILFCSALSLVGFAQQRPHYTQYILNNYILNPALSGIENYADLKISGRDQWLGLNGAPKTSYLSIHLPIGKKDLKTTATSFQIPGENPLGNAYWQNYTASEPHHGVGATVINDATGNYNRFTANLSYAYHLGLNEKTNLSMGFSAGISKLNYDRSKAEGIADPDDLVIGNGNNEISKVHPDLNIGMWLYSSDYFVGVSAQQVIPLKLALTNNTTGYSLLPHIFATAGYRFLITEDINAVPSVMVKYVSPKNPQFDLNFKLQYQDLLWLGGSYRLQNGYSGMVGLNVGNTFNIGYAYDYTKTVINTASNGTHEVIIGFLLGNRYGDTCPRNVW